jgi:hypothetical protein
MFSSPKSIFKGNLFLGGSWEVPFPRASGEKCFVNPKGFRKFFECTPNYYAKDFVGGGVIPTNVNLLKI